MTRLLGILLLAIGLCLPAETSAETVLRLGNGPDPETLDPQRAQSVSDANLAMNLFEGLVTLDATGRAVPGVAERWTVSPDGLLWTFTLRPDASWSDGSPVTAGDFVFAWRRLLDPASRAAAADMLFPVRDAEAVFRGRKPPSELGVRAADARTLEVALERPKADFHLLLHHRATVPLHRPSLERFGPEFTRPGNLVSNGAFMLAEARPQDALVLRRNPHFHAAATVWADRVELVITEDAQTEFKRFRAGELHATFYLPTNQLDWAKANLADAVRVAPYAAVGFYTPNLEVAPWKDAPGLRRALSLAIDRAVIAEKVLKSGDLPAYTLVPPGLEGYAPPAPEEASWTQAQREAEAKRLYAAAGYGPDKPLAFTLLYPTNENARAMAVAVAAMWKQVLGVQATLENQEQKVVAARLKARDYTGIARRGAFGPYPDKYLETLRSGEPNGPGYANPAFDRAYAAALAAGSAGEARRLLAEAEAIALKDAAIIPIVHPTSKHLVSPRLKGWTDNALDAHPLRYLSLEK
ncbi:MAG TPA: peptide ABC transporter substrate-binding protein [Azospirillaceae bacterium]|nr:peptide ABC transporter substrate-binding protein [Azospirillaceae bacterium]